MLGVNARPKVAKLLAPLVARLHRAGVTADGITVVGTLGSVVAA